MNTKNTQYIAKTLYGLEDVLAEELTNIGAQQVTKANRAIYFAGDKDLLYKANFNLRTAISILQPINTFKAKDENELYRKIQETDWSKIFSTKQTFAVESTVFSSVFKHSQYISLKTKDAIVDQFRTKQNVRPDVNTENPDILINIHISEDNCTLSLNSSGEPLFKRGYRIATRIAPLNEVLAAGLIKLSGWKPEHNFIDPMCGSGTLPIEAALIAGNIPPGIFRKKFSFENWNDFDPDLFKKNIIDLNILKGITFQGRIIGVDQSSIAIEIAKNNIKDTILENLISFETTKFQDYKPSVNSGVIITNPPYGERIKMDNIENFYKLFGDTLKRNYPNFVAWVLSSNKEAMKFFGLHPSKKIKIMNASLECTFNKYELYVGSLKIKNMNKKINNLPKEINEI